MKTYRLRPYVRDRERARLIRQVSAALRKAEELGAVPNVLYLHPHALAALVTIPATWVRRFQAVLVSASGHEHGFTWRFTTLNLKPNT